MARPCHRPELRSAAAASAPVAVWGAGIFASWSSDLPGESKGNSVDARSVVFEVSELCSPSESKSGTAWKLGSALASSDGVTEAAAASAGSAGTPLSASVSAAAWLRRSALSIPVLIRSHRSGAGSTASTITLSSPSRCSHSRTVSAKPASCASNASAWSRSSADSVPRTYSAASASRSSSYIGASIGFCPEDMSHAQSVGSCPHTLANFEQTTAKPRLDRVHRNIELGRQLIAAPTAVISKQHDALLFRVEPAETGEQPLEFDRHLASRQGRRRLGGGLGRLGLFIDRNVSPLARDVDGAIARHRDHPGDWTCRCRIELICHFPHFEVGLRHDLFGQCGLSQYARHKGVQMRPRRPW